MSIAVMIYQMNAGGIMLGLFPNRKTRRGMLSRCWNGEPRAGF